MKNQKKIIYVVAVMVLSFLTWNTVSEALSKTNEPQTQSTISKLKINEKIIITVNSFTHHESIPKQTLVIKRTKNGFIAEYDFFTKRLGTEMNTYSINRFNDLEKQLNFIEDTPFTCTKTSEYTFASKYKNFKSIDTRCKFKAFDTFIEDLFNERY
jgi:hypothetical protein